MGRFSIFALMMFLVSMIMISNTSAYTFVVGGRNGWVPNPSESYNSWAERMRYSVNDTLVFRYGEGDSVLLVTREDYDSCNISNPIEIYAGGYSEFVFQRSGPFFFIGGAPGNCERDEKLIVVVLAVRRNSTGTTSAPPNSSPPSSSPASPPTIAPLAPSPESISPSSSPTASPPSTSPELAPSPLSEAGFPPVASSTPAQSPTFEPSPPAPPAPPNSGSSSGGSSGNETSPTTPGGSSRAAPSSASWTSAFLIGAASMFLTFLCF